MKRVMISSCLSAISLFFCVYAVESGKVRSDSQHRRISSIAELRELSPVETTDRATFSIKEYQQLAYRFYAENCLEEVAPNVQQEMNEQMAEFDSLGKVVGFKEYKKYDEDEKKSRNCPICGTNP
ncbi:hypothetical protein FACS189449_06430 [Alphaproteobacteria bacterium]|nr:hypothetical protein FACS189449_06430 [Alphaproteobacteria bacterium]